MIYVFKLINLIRYGHQNVFDLQTHFTLYHSQYHFSTIFPKRNNAKHYLEIGNKKSWH